MERAKIILDTDIGTDIDDVFALLLALRSPEIKLEAVTTVHGDTGLRAGIAKKILKLSQRDDIPVGRGSSGFLSKGKKASMGGWEGKGFLEPYEFESNAFPDAIDLIVSRVMENSGKITIITIGPLTNLALAVNKEPEITKNIKQLIAMGGVINTPKLGWPWGGEYNFGCDPEAAKLVFDSGIPITMVGLDVTLDVWLREKDIKKLRKTDTPLMRGILSMLDIWLKKTGDNKTCLHDPLAVSVAIDRSLVTTKRTYIDLEMEQNVLRTIPCKYKKPEIDVCMEVNSKRFHEFFMERILADSFRI